MEIYQLPDTNIRTSSCRQFYLEKENEALQAVVTTRKAQLSGKRKVIEGKQLLTTVEICAGVVAAENASKKRK